MLKKLSILGMMLLSTSTFANNSILYSCPVKNGDRVQVILSKGVPTYQYFSQGKAQLKLPRSSPANNVKYANFSYSGGGAEYYRFINGDYSYVVYSGIGRGWQRDEVMVFKGLKKISTLKCKSAFTSNTSWSARDSIYDESASHLSDIFSE